MVEDKGVKLLIDPKAVLFLLGTEMDCKVDKLSAQFVFNNPNQTSACGCGESVLLTPAADPAAPKRTEPAASHGRRSASANCFANSGPCRVRRMFGGAGIFADGLMIALVSRRRDLSQGRRRDDPGFRARRAGARSATRPRTASAR